MTEQGSRLRMSSLATHVPPGQFVRYLLVGAWNTFFGYGTYALLTALLESRVLYGYVLASILASLINITVAYFGYKWFVFKTKGNYLREWLRCVAVYSGGIAISAAMLPVLVGVIRHYSRFHAAAPYIAGAVMIAFTTIYNFLGHKKFSFRAEPS